MSICGIGIDHIDIAKFKSVLEKRRERFIKRIFTEKERELAGQKNFLMTLAGRYVSKEAVFKALSPAKNSGISWKDIEVLNEESGTPIVTLYGKALELFNEKNMKKIFISISHTNTCAFAMVVVEKD
ncbi:MAG: holo-[acyl-carrier-protein] synthase [Candidatus Schekmanbacteria bacterium]|nr:MAG: holo-[acyl-carrier-protein] synthase [Candidatus Schekmanbacteria bacterium]